MSPFRDLRFALRALGRNPGFTWTAIPVIALGIAASTAVFSVVDKALLEPLPYPEPGRLVQLMTSSPLGDETVVSIPKYLTWRDHTSVFESIAAYDIGGAGATLTENAFPEAFRAIRVSAGYFRLFGAHAERGRTFSAAEDRPDGARVAVLSDRVWRSRFHADLGLIGRYISLNFEPHQVIGILAPGFAPGFEMDPPADIWLPLQADASHDDHIGRVRVAARLAPGVTLDEAQKDVGATIGTFDRSFPRHLLFFETFTAISLRDAVLGDVRPALALLAGAVGFVLLISCANVANLLLTRATRRAREIAIRAAMGARSIEIVRHLLAESLALSFGGGALGLLLGYLGVRELLALSPAEIPRMGANGSALALDWRVFLFTLLVSALTGILFGLMPALDASRADISSLVKDQAFESGLGLRRHRGRSALMIVEMALALVLLSGAALLIRTFVAMRTADPGFDERNVLTAQMSLAGPQFARTTQVAQLARDVERRLRKIPGVAEAAGACALPLEPSLTMPFTVYGRDRSLTGRYHGVASWRSVSPGYFDAFRIRLLRGRLFDGGDDEQAAPVMLINQAMLRRFWQEVDANSIGQFVTIGIGMGAGLEEGPRQVIGVVGDVRNAGLGREPMMYVPLAQLADRMNARNNRLFPIAWVIRTAEGAQTPTAAIAQELREASGGLPFERVRTMHEVVAAIDARTGFFTMLLTVFAAIALFLAAVGLYGLMAFSVQQRTQEIGIRMALGAGPDDVRWMVMVQGMRLAILGILIGIPAALALTRVMIGTIFGIRTWDPAALALVALLLGAVALLATWLPSLRATRVNPLDALRW